MNVFTVFVKFLGWIVAIWVSLVRLIEIIKKLREFEFLIEERDIILIKYYILFLTTYYNQLVFIPNYFSCKKFSFSLSITHGFLVVK